MTGIMVQRELEFDGAIAGDIAITAAEGGVNYWAHVPMDGVQYDYERWTHEDGENEKVPDSFVFYTLDDGDGYVFDVTPALIRLGIQRYAAGTEPGQRGSSFEARDFDDMDDLAAMDSSEADCVIQLGAFGELVFG